MGAGDHGRGASVGVPGDGGVLRRRWAVIPALFLGPLLLVVAALYKLQARRFPPGTWAIAWAVALAPLTLVILAVVLLASAGGRAPAEGPVMTPPAAAAPVATQPAAVAAAPCPPPVNGTPPPAAGLNATSSEAQFVAAVAESPGDDPCTTVKKAFNKVLDRAFCDEDETYLSYFWQDAAAMGNNNRALIAEERQRGQKLCGDTFTVTAVIASSPTAFTVEGDYGWQYEPSLGLKHGQLRMIANPDPSNPAQWLATCLASTCPSQ